MIPQYNKVHNRFKLNGIHYSQDTLKIVAYSYIKEGLLHEKVIGDFLLDWSDSKTYVEVQTSGSTGIPKTIRLHKQAMVHSALATGDFFKLNPGDTALHCLPSNFIAGKMMLVRAIILGLELDLTQPVSQPIFDYEKHYDFAAMVPMQLEKIYTYCKNIKTIIVGGAPVSSTLKSAITNIKSVVYETYGMTETITHIAARQLNNLRHAELVSASHFNVLPNIVISQDERDCLVIEAPKLSKEKIVTNDIVKLHSENEFEWLGRYDNVINSGGIKLYPEQIEKKLSEVILQRFFIASQIDNQLGKKVILVIESDDLDLEVILNKVKNIKSINKYEIPKQIYLLPKFIETSSGKIQRSKTLELIK